MTPDYKSQSRGYSRDMSSVAIAKRLDKVAELYELWKFLRTGKRVVRERPERQVRWEDEDEFRRPPAPAPKQG